MICYKDRSFCVSPECTNKCGRKLTDEIKADAEKWWGGPGAPISMAYYCDEQGEPYMTPSREIREVLADLKGRSEYKKQIDSGYVEVECEKLDILIALAELAVEAREMIAGACLESGIVDFLMEERGYDKWEARLDALRGAGAPPAQKANP